MRATLNQSNKSKLQRPSTSMSSLSNQGFCDEASSRRSASSRQRKHTAPPKQKRSSASSAATSLNSRSSRRESKSSRKPSAKDEHVDDVKSQGIPETRESKVADEHDVDVDQKRKHAKYLYRESQNMSQGPRPSSCNPNESMCISEWNAKCEFAEEKSAFNSVLSLACEMRSDISIVLSVVSDLQSRNEQLFAELLTLRKSPMGELRAERDDARRQVRHLQARLQEIDATNYATQKYGVPKTNHKKRRSRNVPAIIKQGTTCFD